MIRKVKISNFQSHGKTTLEFHKGVNVIIGTSDSGKSAIMKAIRWLVYNRPTGDSFKSYWGGDTVVTIVFDNGDKVTRRKGEKNYYKTIVNGEKQIHKAFGTSVPEEVQKVLNLNDLNIQQQLDSPFLLSNTSGEVATHFNKVADLSIIDSTTSNLNKQVYETNRQVESLSNSIKTNEDDLKSYEYLDVLEVDILDLEDIEKDLKNSYSLSNSLKILIGNIQGIENEIEKKEYILKMEKDVDKILSVIDDEKKTEEQITNLVNLIDDIEVIEHSINEKTEILGAEGFVTDILKEINEEKAITSQIRDLNNKIVQIRTINKKLLKTQEKAKKQEIQFHKFMPTICPLCETDLKNKQK